MLATLTKVGAGFIRMFGLPGLLIGGATIAFNLLKSKIDEVFDDLEKFNDKVIEKVGNAAVAVYTFKNPNATKEEKAIAFANATNGIIPGAGFIGDMLKLKNVNLGNAWNTIKNSKLGQGISKSGGLSFSGTKSAKGIRNNNPLNLNFAKQSGAWKDNDSAFAVFDSAYDGIRANVRQLMMYFNGTSEAAGFKKLQTVEEIITKWAPPEHKGNDTEGYIQRVTKELGVKRNQRLDLNDTETMYALIHAMSLVENQNQFPYPKELVTAAIMDAPDPTIKPSAPINLNTNSMSRAALNLGSMGQSGQFVPEYLIRNDSNSSKQVSISPTYNINVTGGQSPHETAALTGEAMGRQNQILVRNLENKVG